MEQLSWRLRVTSGPDGVARVSARRHQFTVGRPVGFDAEYGELTAFEYALGALGGEVVTGLRAFARRRRIGLDQVEAVVTGELENPLTYLEVIGEQGHPGVSRIGLKVYVASSHDETAIRQLWDDTIARLPLVRTFGASVALTLNLSLTR